MKGVYGEMSNKDDRINILKESISKAAGGAAYTYIFGGIPEIQLGNACKEYASDIDMSGVLAMIDSSFPKGDGTKGALFTEDGIWWNTGLHGENGYVSYTDLASGVKIPQSLLRISINISALKEMIEKIVSVENVGIVNSEPNNIGANSLPEDDSVTKYDDSTETKTIGAGEKFCKYCGRIIDFDSVFCRFCGADLSSVHSDGANKADDTDKENMDYLQSGIKKMLGYIDDFKRVNKSWELGRGELTNPLILDEIISNASEVTSLFSGYYTEEAQAFELFREINSFFITLARDFNIGNVQLGDKWLNTVFNSKGQMGITTVDSNFNSVQVYYDFMEWMDSVYESLQSDIYEFENNFDWILQDEYNMSQQIPFFRSFYSSYPYLDFYKEYFGIIAERVLNEIDGNREKLDVLIGKMNFVNRMFDINAYEKKYTYDFPYYSFRMIEGKGYLDTDSEFQLSTFGALPDAGSRITVAIKMHNMDNPGYIYFQCLGTNDQNEYDDNFNVIGTKRGVDCQWNGCGNDGSQLLVITKGEAMYCDDIQIYCDNYPDCKGYIDVCFF